MPTLPEHVHDLGRRFPDGTAHAVADGDRMTFAEWDAAANRIARALAAAGVRPGDRVVLAFDDHDYLRHVQAYVGVQRAGGVCVIGNVHYRGEELARILEPANPVALLGSGSCRDRLEAVADALDIDTVVSTDGAVGAPWEAFLADDDRPVETPVGEDDPADVLFTSGTTGRPTPLLARHRNLTHADPTAVETFSGQHVIHATPVPSQVVQSMILAPAGLGCTSLFVPGPFDPGRWVAAVRRYRPIIAYLAPVMVEQLVRLDDVDPDDLSSLTLVTVGNSTIAVETLRRLDALLPNARPQNTYTLTELGTAFVSLPPGEFDARPGSVGRPEPPLEVRIVEPATLREVPAGQEGEILVRAPGLEREPLAGEPGHDRRDGWLVTGDRGIRDEDGFLTVLGRLDDVIIRGGYNVDPAEAESAILRHPSVTEAAVVGIPHPELGQELAAAVVLDAGTATEPADLERWLEANVGEPLRPRRVQVVDRLPRTSNGKVLRDRVRELLRPSEVRGGGRAP